MTIEKIKYIDYIKNKLDNELSLDYDSFETALMSSFSLDPEDLNLDNIYILNENEYILFITDQFLYLPLKIKNYETETKDLIFELTREDSEISKKINFKLLTYDNEENLEELSELIYLNYFLSDDDLKIIADDPSLHSDKIESYISNNELYFMYISLDNLNFKFTADNEKKNIFKWIKTLILQIAEKSTLNISLFKKGNNGSNINRCYVKKTNSVNTEIVYDSMSLQYLSRGQKFYQESPHISYLEYYHVLERFMKEHRFNIFIENYKDVYQILLSDEKDITKKTKVINTISDLDKKFSELNALTKILDDVIDNNTYSKIINNDVLGSTVKSEYIQILEKNAPFWDKRDDLKINKNTFKEKIATRLYATRNSIVHSKSFDGEDTFDVDNEEHMKFLKVDLFILKYLVICFLNHSYKGSKQLSHFFSFETIAIT